MLSKDTSGLGVGCPRERLPALSDLSITGLTTGRKRKYEYELSRSNGVSTTIITGYSQPELGMAKREFIGCGGGI
jgi:hypothetical protein